MTNNNVVKPSVQQHDAAQHDKLQAVVNAGEQAIRLAERHMRLIANTVPAAHTAPMRQVMLKLKEARFWLNEVADRG